jgi:predicted pyridoxine 5'-phosphate oxidase superfamily flavin-nucleotide-binding protein
MRTFGDLMFTPGVADEQARDGSRDNYAKMAARPAPSGLADAETAFIEARDSFYLATVTQTGWPYVQHRGGPRGFLKVLSPTIIGFADYRGNRQFVSTGNLKQDNRAALFLMDYPNRRRLKILAHAAIVMAEGDEALAARLAIDGGGRVQRLFTFEIEAFDWNCPQFITPRFTTAEIQASLGEKITDLETENKSLRARLAALGG